MKPRRCSIILILFSVLMMTTGCEQASEAPVIKNAILEIQQLKIYQPIESYTSIDFRLTNKSNMFIEFWTIEADIFNSDGEYLGHDLTIGKNLRADQSVTAQLNYANTIPREVASWKPYISEVHIV